MLEIGHFAGAVDDARDLVVEEPQCSWTREVPQCSRSHCQADQTLRRGNCVQRLSGSLDYDPIRISFMRNSKRRNQDAPKLRVRAFEVLVSWMKSSQATTPIVASSVYVVVSAPVIGEDPFGQEPLGQQSDQRAIQSDREMIGSFGRFRWELVSVESPVSGRGREAEVTEVEGATDGAESPDGLWEELVLQGRVLDEEPEGFYSEVREHFRSVVAGSRTVKKAAETVLGWNWSDRGNGSRTEVESYTAEIRRRSVVQLMVSREGGCRESNVFSRRRLGSPGFRRCLIAKRGGGASVAGCFRFGCWGNQLKRRVTVDDRSIHPVAIVLRGGRCSLNTNCVCGFPPSDPISGVHEAIQKL